MAKPNKGAERVPKKAPANPDRPTKADVLKATKGTFPK